MIASNSRDQKVVEAKQEAGDAAADEGKFLKAAAASTSRQWSAFRNPRIVRVSKTFGGKDRHSKVCTIRGLRDRRIRLSVPTAIQLYDLQDRLGVGQPSKVIDWLLDACKDDIDKLPPLQLPQMFDHQFRQQQQMLVSNNEYLNQSLQYYSSLDPFPDANYMLIKHGHHHHHHHHVGLPFLGMKTNFSTGLDFHDEDQSACRANSKSCRDDAEKASLLRAKSKEIEQGYHDGVCNYSGNSTSTTGQVSAQPLFPLTSCNSSSSSLPAGNYGILNYNSMPFNSYYHHLDSSNLSLSQFGSSHGFLSHQQADQNPLNNNNDAAVSFPMMPSSFAGSHLFFCPPPTMSPLFPPPFYNPYNCNASAGDRREANNFQLLATSSRATSSSTRPDDSPSLNPGLVHLRWNKESHDHGKVNNDNS